MSHKKLTLIVASKVLLVLGLLTLEGCGSSKQSFYDNAMKLADASFKLSMQGEGDYRIGELERYKDDLARDNDEIARINKEIEQLENNIKVCKETGICNDKSAQDYINSFKRGNESLKKDMEKYAKLGRDDVVQRNRKEIATNEDSIKFYTNQYILKCQDDLERLKGQVEQTQESAKKHQAQIADTEKSIQEKPFQPNALLSKRLTVGELKERLGTPNSIIKNGSSEQIWVFEFSDGQVHVKIYASGRGIESDEDKIYLNPHELEML